MTPLFAAAAGVLAAMGFVTVLAGLTRQPERTAPRMRTYRQRLSRMQRPAQQTQRVLSTVLAVVLGWGAWISTGWLVAGLLGAASGITAPLLVAAPRRRRAAVDEIEAYSQWTEQLRDLVQASGSLLEAVVLSAANAPPKLRPHVEQLATLAQSIGLKPALNWFAAHMESPYADQLVLGLSIAWESGARVSDTFDATARAMRNEVQMRRTIEVGNARVWSQVMAILGITVVSVVLMFVFNRGFFDPFGTLLGQVVLLVIGLLIFGCVFWVLGLSRSGSAVRLLGQHGLPGSERTPAAAGDSSS
ncbi:MAG: type II secretion system F family protein [Acidimicrobiales bacterium]|nr:type II secretion system F family protein [Acidimicrobiaceae bacterium]MXX41529.1 type II secretion system F family protein [Acidimicrobiales bacterium]MYD32985.1 type II secretion system F family protein [Acidimicrobiales bacterium]MYI08538.1 type II secretion system F family protein [Acidimicrobiales bacterium]MYI13764.1 type II secretion system F family protein [Acidimicrobiales bacterium]